MTYVILLDSYQDQVGPDQFAVTYSSGDLEACEAQTNHDGRFEAWLRADFVERGSRPVALEGPEGEVDRGVIAELEEVAAPLAAKLAKLALPALVAGAAVAGAIAIARRRKPRRAAGRRRRP
jgi:hypothetical protein